jgi:hypothetical protein
LKRAGSKMHHLYNQYEASKKGKYNLKHRMTLIFRRYSWYISNPVVTKKFLLFIHIESIIDIPNFITTYDNYNYYAITLWLHHTVLISNHQKDFCRGLENIYVSVMQETYTIDLNGIKSWGWGWGCDMNMHVPEFF